MDAPENTETWKSKLSAGKDITTFVITIILFVGSIVSVYTSMKNDIQLIRTESTVNRDHIERNKKAIDDYRSNFSELIQRVSSDNVHISYVQSEIDRLSSELKDLREDHQSLSEYVYQHK